MKSFWKKQAPLIVVSILVIGVSFGAGFASGLRSHPAIESVTTLDGKENGKPANVDFSSFWKVWNTLNEKYVSSATTTSDQDKVWGATEGLASSLHDPYTVFFPPKSSEIFQSEISGNFDGVGMEVGVKDDMITVIAPLKGTPADKAGILSGDEILRINDSGTANMKLDDAINMIRGKKGTPVRLTVLHQGKKEPVEITIIRDTIAIPTIDTELKQPLASGGASGSSEGLKDNGIFIIRLYTFTANSPDLFRQALRKFVESGSHKLIIDLRGNPGGFLEAAVDMASWFLPAGEVVVSEDFGKNQPEQIYRSKGYDIFSKNLKLVILVDGGSASASEIFSGALKQHGIATLVGSTTFGKGSVQELVDITPDTSLKVTIARWLTPDGTSISEKGITPDVSVPMTADDAAKGKDPQMDAAVKLLTKGQ